MDRLEAMKMLVETIDCGSLSAAGRKLGVPLPTISRKIAELESQLGARVLIRTTRRLTLTEAGIAYLAACRSVLDQVRIAEQVVASEHTTPKGELAIAAPSGLGRQYLLPVIADYLARNPEVDIQLLLSDRNTHLIDDHIDLALRVGALEDTTMIAVRVGEVRQVVCASPGFLAAHGTPEAPRDLTERPCVSHDYVGPARSWTFAARGAKRRIEVPIRPRLSVTLAEAAVDVALAGIGVVRLLSYQVAPWVRRGDLCIVLRDFEPEPLPINLIHTGQGRLPLRTRSFLDHAAPVLRTMLAD